MISCPPKVAAERRAGELLLVARWPVGGIRTHLGYNHAALVEAGWRTTLVVPDDASLPPLRATLHAGSPRFVATPPGRLWRSVGGELLARRHSLIHAHGMTAAVHAALAGLCSRAPLVVTLHEPLRDEQFRGVTGWMKRRAAGLALGRAAAIITVSQDARANLLSYFPGLASHRVHTIPNGIDAERYDEPIRGGTLRGELKLDKRTILIGYLGRFMPEKGFPLLLDAVERLVGNTRAFHIVAFGSSDYRDAYQNRIDERGVRPFVTLRDFVSDVRPVLAELDLVVVPSLWEASSLVSMEAMCAGVPVLGSDCPGLREVLHETPSRTVAAGDVAALEAGLTVAIRAPWMEEAQQFAPCARQRFDNRHSARRLVELYASLTEAHR